MSKFNRIYRRIIAATLEDSYTMITADELEDMGMPDSADFGEDDMLDMPDDFSEEPGIDISDADSDIDGELADELVTESPSVETLLENKDWDGIKNMILKEELVDGDMIVNVVDIMMSKYRIEPLVDLILFDKIKKSGSIDQTKINHIIDIAIEAGEWEQLFKLLDANKIVDAEKLKQIFDDMYSNEEYKFLNTLRNRLNYKELIEDTVEEFEEGEIDDFEDEEDFEEDEIDFEDEDEEEEITDDDEKQVTSPIDFEGIEEEE